MSNRFTPDQDRAIHAIQGNILVSAGAGSGKTTVLTERVLHLFIDHHVQFPEMLVLTFTRLAAQEMKDRIRDELLKRGYSNASSLVESSFITTFDAYALSIVKKYGYLLKVSRNVEIMDDLLYDINLAKIIDEVMNETYLKNDPEFENFIIAHMGKNDQVIKKWLMEAYRIATLSGDFKTFIKNYSKTYLSQNFVNRKIQQVSDKVLSLINEIRELIPRIHPLAIKPVINQNMGLAAISDFEQLPALLPLKKIRKNAPRNIEYSEDEEWARLAYCNLIEKLNEIGPDCSRINLEEGYTATYPHIKVMLGLLETIDNRINDFQSSQEAYRFYEIAQMATILVGNPEVQQEIKSQINYIMIDEYQDTSDIQEKFILNLTQNNLFMVGDIKQSIYAFRQANCDIFAAKLADYQKQKNGRLITLSENFRSRKEVVEAVNNLFSKIMSLDLGGADFRHGHQLKAANPLFETKDEKGQHYGFSHLTYEEDSDEDKGVTEARLIGQDILNKISSGMMFTKKGGDKNNHLVPASFGDFTILIAKKTKFGDYKKVFLELGIPLYVVESENITDTHVSRVLQNIVHLLVDWADLDLKLEKYRHYLASILRSYLFEEHDQKILDLLNNLEVFKNHPLYALYADLVAKSENLSVGEIVEKIIQTFNFYERLPLLGEIESNKRYIATFQNLAAKFGGYGYLLHDFAQLFDLINEYEIEIKIDPSIPQEGAVRLMTVHKSKGLGFKFVYFAGFGDRYNEPENQSAFLATLEDGFLLPNYTLANPKLRFTKMALQERIKANRSERLRLLYVALTRAMEGGVIVYQESKTKDYVNKKLIDLASFKDLILWGEMPLTQIEKKKEPLLKTIVKTHKAPEIEMSFPSLNLPKTPKVTARASISPAFKEFEDIMILDYGTHLHNLLALVDLKVKNADFIHDEKDKELIQKLLNMPIFMIDDEAEIYHEWPFYDEELDLYGIIDLLIIQKDVITVIDFKTSNIDNPSYDEQVKKYCDYLSKTYLRPVKGYLASIVKTRYRQV